MKAAWMRGFLVLLGLTSCTQLPRVPGPSFTLSGPLPSTLTIPQGGNQATWITLTPEESFAGSVHLTLAHWDGSSAPGFALTPSSVWLSGNAVHETLGDSALDTLAPRSYALKLRAQSGHLAQEKDLGVLVLLALKPRLPGRGENGYFVATHLGQTLRPHQGAGFRLEVLLGFTLTLSPGALTQGGPRRPPPGFPEPESLERLGGLRSHPSLPGSRSGGSGCPERVGRGRALPRRRDPGASRLLRRGIRGCG